MNLKQAILTLPKLDARWKVNDVPDHHYATYLVSGETKIMIDYGIIWCIEPMALVAAAKTVEIDIYWRPAQTSGKYWANFSAINDGYNWESNRSYSNAPKAIRAAFIAAMTHAKEHITQGTRTENSIINFCSDC